ncbi:MAG: protein kinase [Candidatus Melainabacteria bacterium]|nr:protein kinase [Candidatus Melainabacteria bacterium]
MKTTIDDRYSLDDLIGSGGIGEVYSGYDQKLLRPVAVKLLKTADIGLQSIRFQNEARILASLNHPNILQILDFGVFEQKLYLVTELLKGNPLDKVISRQGPISPSRTVEIFSPVLDALHYAHSSGIIHRDLKPSNIFLSPEPIILDFGIAKSLSPFSQDLTETGSFIGSPAYTSPEQAGSGQISQASDIYSLGCTMFTALTGKPPFAGQTALETIRMHIDTPPPRLAQINPSLIGNDDLEDLIARCLEKDPADRFPDAETLKIKLLSLRFKQDETVAPNLIPDTNQKLSGPSLSIFGLIAIFLIILFVAGTYLFYAFVETDAVKQGSKVRTKKVDLTSESKVYEEAIQEGIPSFKECSGYGRIFFLPNPTEQTIENFFKSKCRALALSNTDTDGSVLSLLRGRQVAWLNLSDNPIKDSNLGLLNGISGLESVGLINTSVSARGLELISPSLGLKRIYLRQTDIGDEALEQLGRLTSLERIYLRDCRGVTDRGISFLSGLHKLTHLELRGTSVTGRSTSSLAAISGLQRLDLGDLDIDDRALPPLARLTRLEALSLAGTRITKKGLDQLSRMSRLRFLDLSRLGLTRDDLKALSALPASTLVLSENPLEAKDLNGLLDKGKIIFLKKGPKTYDSRIQLISAPISIDFEKSNPTGELTLEWSPKFIGK